MTTDQEFIELGQAVERGLMEEMSRRTLSDDVAPRQQLDFMLSEVRRVVADVQNGRRPTEERPHLASAHLVVDSWPFDHPLGRMIARLSMIYGQLRRSANPFR